MPKKIGSVTRQALVNAPLPSATQTYTVISHQFVIDTVTQELNNNGFSIEKELYKCTDGAQVASGLFKLTYGNDPELSLMYAFGNSYDKTMKFKSAVGVYVNQNDTVMISKFNDWTRKHTGSADDETVETITTQIAQAAQFFDELKYHKDLMININVNRLEFAAIVGELFFLKFITIDQVSIILKEYDNPSFTYAHPAESLWTCYNHILVALKRTHPKNWIDNQIAVHLHICNKYRLYDYSTTEEDVEEVEDMLVEENATGADYDIDKEPEEEVIYQTEEEVAFLPGFESNETANDFTSDLDAEEDADWEKLPISEVKEIVNTEEESTVEATEDEVVSQLYGVDNDIEVSIPAAEEEEDIVEEDVFQMPEPVEETPIVKAKDTKPFPLEEVVEEKTTDEIVATVIHKTLNPEPKGDEDFVDDVDKVIEEPVTSELTETFYFMKEDYEDVSIGDYIEEDGQYFNIINDESGDDGNFWVAIQVSLDDESEEVIDDTVDEIVEELTDELPVADTVIEPEVVNVVQEIPVMDAKVKAVIKEELAFLYDYEDLEFTYTLQDGQYNIIILNSGETCTLTQGYIDQQV